MRGRVFSAAERAEVIEKYRASGLSVDAFVVQEGMGSSTLYDWLARTRRSEKPLRVARVIRRQVAALVATPVVSAVVIEVAGTRVQVTPGFDAATVSAVLDLLESRARGAS